MVAAITLLGLLASGPGMAAPGSRRASSAARPAERIDDIAAGATSTKGRPAARFDRLDEERERATLFDGRDLILEVLITAGDTRATLGLRYLEDPRLLPAVRGLQAEALPAPGRFIGIPYELLNPEYRLRVLHDLFPADLPGERLWVHHVGAGRLTNAEQGLWNLALWYTGRGENFEAIADRNDLPDLNPRAGGTIVIPGEILLAPFAGLAGVEAPESRFRFDDDFSRTAKRLPPQPAATAETGVTAAPVAPPPPPRDGPPGADEPGVSPAEAAATGSGTVVAAEGADDLEYGTDAAGPHAIYRLKQGEALYSAVVVRFTGRIDVQDVNDLARQVAARSAIRNVTRIPVGYPVKIPLDHLLPEYLPRDDDRRIAWERSTAGVARYTNQARSRDLEGVAVILDAGHGGRDRGAAHNGIWEHDYVYDILCRIKAVLEKNTRARVLTTIRDRKDGYKIHDQTKLRRNQAEILLTDPPFRLRQGTISVNLRWYLANAYYRMLMEEGFDPLKVVFTSLHADARHPSLTGAMIYVPGEEYRRGRYGNGSPVYAKYREVRQAPYVKFPRAARERSEGLSREFAASLIDAFRAADLPVYAHGPVRERIIRRGRSWVPAVLRCNIVPVEVLLEVCNLSNRADGKRLAKPSYRQKVAEAYVEALRQYYGGRDNPVTAAAARSR